MTDDVPCCPDCSSTKVRSEVGSDEWDCDKCGESFEEPYYRPPSVVHGDPSKGGSRRSKYGQALLDADPDETLG